MHRSSSRALFQSAVFFVALFAPSALLRAVLAAPNAQSSAASSCASRRWPGAIHFLLDHGNRLAHRTTASQQSGRPSAHRYARARNAWRKRNSSFPRGHPAPRRQNRRPWVSDWEWFPAAHRCLRFADVALPRSESNQSLCGRHDYGRRALHRLFIDTLSGCSNSPAAPNLVLGNISGPVPGCPGPYTGQPGI